MEFSLPVEFTVQLNTYKNYCCGGNYRCYKIAWYFVREKDPHWNIVNMWVHLKNVTIIQLFLKFYLEDNSVQRLTVNIIKYRYMCTLHVKFCQYSFSSVKWNRSVTLCCQVRKCQVLFWMLNTSCSVIRTPVVMQ